MKKALLIFLIIVLVIFLLEVMLRIAGFFYLRKLYVLPFYPAKTAGKNINIVCLGESTTAGLWVNWQDSYPKQLEAKLRKFYDNQNIRVIVPPHVGQNTSQMSNRIKQYISSYNPKLMILMVGSNNEWSLSESHIARFISNGKKDASQVRSLVVLNNFRLLKMLRYLYLKFISKEDSDYVSQNEYCMWGHPEKARFPPERWIYSFAKSNRKAFVEMWKYDVREIIHQAKNHNIEVILMTYHINPGYLPAEEFIALAEEEGVLLIRNDQSFDMLIKNGSINNYLQHDNWHLNKQGYSMIANNALECIKENNLLSF